MRDRHGILFHDEFSLSFHMHFYKLLKWLVALPVWLTLAAIMLMGKHLSLPV